MSKRILIVENDPDVAFLVSALLERDDYQCLGTAATGQRALEMAAELQPDVVLMDIMLDGPMDGIETAARLRVFSGAHVIFMSAHLEGEKLENVKLAKPAGFIAKPFLPEAIKNAIEKSERLEVSSEVGSTTDHDLLVRLDTKLDLVSIQLNEARVKMGMKADSARVDKLERLVDGKSESKALTDLSGVVDGIKSKVLMATGALAVLQFLLQKLWH